MKIVSILILFFLIFSNTSFAENYCSKICNCIGYNGISGPCYDGIGGPAYDGIGGPCYEGGGGACYDGIGGGLNCPDICSLCKNQLKK